MPSSVRSTGVSTDTSHSLGCPHLHPDEAYRIEDGLHASIAVRLGIMLMLVRRGILVHQFRTSNTLLARDLALLG